MKKVFRTLAAVFAAGFVFAFFGCETDTEKVYVPVEKDGDSDDSDDSENTDTTAPGNVTGLNVTAAGSKVLLTWTDASDSDIFGYEVSYTTGSSGRAAISAMDANSIFVAPGAGGAVISNLEAGTSYTFTVKTMDTSGNKSAGVSTGVVTISSGSSAMEISLTPSTEDATNENVVVSVGVASEGSVSKISYTSGFSYKVSEVLDYGTNITSASSFTAFSNGSFTVAAEDSDGRREITWIAISNIDKTAPKAVSLSSTYSYGDKKITVTWKSKDTDIDHYLLSYSVDGTEKLSEEEATETTYAIAEVDAGSGTYTFTVKAVDKAGNTSDKATSSVTPAEAPFVARIELDRSHIAYNDTNKTINVTVYGSGFDLISSQEDKTVTVQVVNGSNITNYDAEVDAASNTATAAVTAPTVSEYDATTSGTDFIIRAKVCGTIDTDHTATLNISDVAKVESISLSTAQIAASNVASGQTTIATVEGTNFDVAGAITLQLYDSSNAAYGTAVAVDTSSFETHETSFTAEIPIPTDDDNYTVKVLFDGTKQSETATLMVYGAPTFTSFKIPYAGTSKADSKVTATVKGKNFTAPGITEDSFTLTCSEKATITDDAVITVKDYNTLKVTLTIPGTAGEYKVKAASGGESFEGTFTVKDYSTYTAGQIVLADGSLVDSSEYTEVDKNNPPVAIVAGFNEYGVALGVGLNTSPDGLRWAPSGTTGYNTKFTDIICTPDSDESTSFTATFTGDTDGSDNWDVICSVDPDGSADAATNYPAFNWANNYGTTYADELGSVIDGWYMPSFAELCYVYRNFEIINSALTAMGKTTFKNDWYWSSSQKANPTYYAWHSNDREFSLDSYWKFSDNTVLVVRQL